MGSRSTSVKIKGRRRLKKIGEEKRNPITEAMFSIRNGRTVFYFLFCELFLINMYYWRRRGEHLADAPTSARAITFFLSQMRLPSAVLT